MPSMNGILDQILGPTGVRIVGISGKIRDRRIGTIPHGGPDHVSTGIRYEDFSGRFRNGLQGDALVNDLPILGIQSGDGTIDAIVAELAALPASKGPADLEYLEDLVEAIMAKVAFREKLVAAYDASDRDALRQLGNEEIPKIQLRLENLNRSFRRQWLRRNKPMGMEVIQIRFGAMRARYEETALRIEEYLSGDISSIEELEARPHDLGPHPVMYFYWLATGSSII